MSFRGLPIAAILALASGCGRSEEPRWIHLTAGFRPAWHADAGYELALETPEGRSGRITRDGNHLWAEVELARADWLEGNAPGLWRAELPLRGLGGPTPDTLARMHSGERTFELLAPRFARPKGELPVDNFYLARGKVFLYLEEGTEPPETTTLGLNATPGGFEAEAWYVGGRRFSGEALPVWPGMSEELVLDLPTESALRFATCVEPAFDAEPSEPVTFRVLLDDVTIFEHEAIVTQVGSYDWHTIALPPEGPRQARLSFAVEGPFAYTSFFTPTVGPSEVGSYGLRPWAVNRADVLVFLADTFRADNLALYGGPAGITPHLEAFAAESLRFRRAWSVSTYTLPAHASMFTAVFPRQNEMWGFNRALPDELTTIAELLRKHGYRTGAITDSAVVSRSYGLDQGFEWFDEAQIDLDSTLERVQDFLDADDGRPVFLWVQTYRTHAPYVVDDADRELLKERIGLDVDENFDELRRSIQILETEAEDASDGSEIAVLARRMQRLYLGTVVDLDRGFGRFLGALESRGLDASGHVVFTSDHGEAFFEHGESFHGGRVNEEQIRVPLLIRGPGIEPRTVAHAASLVDLAPTLADLASVPTPAAWLGNSLLELDTDRPIFAFQCLPDRSSSTLAIVQGDHKVIGFEWPADLQSARLHSAFDLESDPFEQNDLSSSAEGWPEELLRELGPLAERLLEPIVRGREAALSSEDQEHLRALGYGGD